jgi:ferric-chelate reductase
MLSMGRQDTMARVLSFIENPVNPQERQIFLQKAGDWTCKVHAILQRDTVRPAWIQGPVPGPYASAEEYGNQILVASGIGITPALSVIRAQKDSRRINLIWTVRDRHLLSFFLRHLYLDNSGWNLIFYTGSEPLETSEIEIFTNTNVCIIIGRRPKLQQTIINIVYGIESGRGLPERYNQDIKQEASTKLAEMVGDDECVSTQNLQDISNWVDQNGFQMQGFESSAISQPRIELDTLARSIVGERQRS